MVPPYGFPAEMVIKICGGPKWSPHTIYKSVGGNYYWYGRR